MGEKEYEFWGVGEVVGVGELLEAVSVVGDGRAFFLVVRLLILEVELEVDLDLGWSIGEAICERGAALGSWFCGIVDCVVGTSDV